ncbi:sigma factor-like helix-turn-helix DNA-binding protein [Kitasatospora sp. Ki12]
MTTPPTADSPTPERHRGPDRGGQDTARLLRKLTPREAQTLAHLAAGHDLPRTAAALGVTPTTARSYLLRAMRKLGAPTQAEAITLAAGALPDVPAALGPTNFAGLTPSSLGPATRAGGDGEAADTTTADQREGATPAAEPGAGTRRGPTARRTREEREDPAHTPAREDPPALAPGADPAADAARGPRPARDQRTGPTHPAPAPPTADGHGPSGAGPDQSEAEHDSAAPDPLAVQAREGQRPQATASEDTRPPSASGNRQPPAAAARTTSSPAPAADERSGPDPADTAKRADAVQEPPAATAPTNHQPSAPLHPASAAGDRQPPAADRRSQAGPGGAERRGGGAGDARASTMAKGSRRPSGVASAGSGGPGDGVSPAGAPRPGTASGERQHPAGTEGHGEMTQTAPVAASAGGRARTAPAVSPPPAGHGSVPAARPVPGFEELYETAHTRLVQQVFLLTACRHRAVHCVRRAFGEARRGWPAAAGSGDPEGWVRVRACELALSPWHRGGPRRAHAWGLPHRRIKVRPADESQAVLPDHDRLTDRDRALLKALRRLSRPQRRALVLHDGLGLPAAAIAVEVESTLAAAEGRVWTARAALAQWVPDLVGPDPAAPGFADGLSRLLHRAAVRGCPEPHRSPVPVLRARHRLWTASRTGAAALLTVAVGGATLATLAGVRPAVLFRPPAPPAPSLCLPAAEVAEPGVPLLPGGVPNGISSLWCSPAPGLEAVLVEPHAQAAARWGLPGSARGADAPPPQGPSACPLWAPRPCATGPRTR